MMFFRFVHLCRYLLFEILHPRCYDITNIHEVRVTYELKLNVALDATNIFFIREYFIKA